MDNNDFRQKLPELIGFVNPDDKRKLSPVEWRELQNEMFERETLWKFSLNTFKPAQNIIDEIKALEEKIDNAKAELSAARLKDLNDFMLRVLTRYLGREAIPEDFKRCTK